MVLRRQLVQEQHRTRPWIRLPRIPHQTIWRRDLHGILRFPVVRLFRMAALTLIAAGCAPRRLPRHRAGRGHRRPRPLPRRLDAVEPLAQEIDQADRADAIPTERGILLVHHLPAPAALLAGCSPCFGGAIAYALNRTVDGARA